MLVFSSNVQSINCYHVKIYIYNSIVSLKFIGRFGLLPPFRGFLNNATMYVDVQMSPVDHPMKSL